MRTRPRAPAVSARTSGWAGGRTWWRQHLRSLLLVALAGALVAGFFLGLYAVRRYSMPIGWDTPRYISQAGFVAERGLAGVPDALPPPARTLESRAAGFPVIALALSSVFRTSTFTLAAVIPAAAAAAVALAAAAWASSGLRLRAWEMAVVGSVVGVSPVVVRLMAPETYTDNLIALALFAAAMVPLTSVVRGGRGVLATVLLLAAGGLAHPSLLVVVVAVLGLTGLAYAWPSWRTWRAGGGLLQTPTVRIGLVVVGGAALTLAAMVVFLRAGFDTPLLARGELVKKLREDIPLYLFPVSLPLAVVGLIGLAGAARRRRSRPDPAGTGGDSLSGHEWDADRPGSSQFILTVSLAWGVVTVLGVVAFLWGRESPAHRFLAFLIPLSILVALAILWLARWAAGSPPASPARSASPADTTSGVHHAAPRRSIGVAVLVAGLSGAAIFGTWNYYVRIPEERGVEWLEIGKVRAAATALAYLDAAQVPVGDPVVYVIDDRGRNPLSYVPEMAYIIRSVLPPDRIERTYFYVGDPERYLAGKATFRSIPRTYNTNMRRFWPTIRDLLPQEPVALLLAAYNGAYEELALSHPDWVVAPGVMALNGPEPPAAVGVPSFPSGPTNLFQGIGLGAGTLILLAVMGLGWGLALLPPGLRPFEVLGLAPAIGLGFLILGGVLVDVAGIRLGGWGGVLTVGLAAASGWLVALRRRGRGTPAGSPNRGTIEP